MEQPSSCSERRQHPRFPVKLPLEYWESPADVLMGGVLANISEEGLRIDSVRSIRIGAELKIRIYVPKEEFTFGIIEGSGKITWRNIRLERDWDGYRHGLCLTEMSAEDRERLRQLLKHQEQESLQ